MQVLNKKLFVNSQHTDFVSNLHFLDVMVTKKYNSLRKNSSNVNAVHYRSG